MKFTGIVFSFYLIFLAAVPCCLADDCPVDKSEQTNQHDTSDGDCGNCSPFFSCQSCIAATIVYEPFRYEFTLFFNKPLFAAYLHPVIPARSFDVWQPPKLG